MKYPCGVIRDLLPLYIDEVCNADSRAAVDEHLQECAECRRCYEGMTDSISDDMSGSVSDSKYSDSKESDIMEDAMEDADEDDVWGVQDVQDVQMLNSLKKIKKRLNKRLQAVIVGALAVIVVALGAFHVLFNMPIKDVALSDVTVTANVYPVGQMVKYQDADDADNDGDMEMSIVYAAHTQGQNSGALVEPAGAADGVEISLGEDDMGEAYDVTFPELSGNAITMTRSVLENCRNITVISWSSPYFLRDIKWAEQNDNESDTLYISDIKTTLLNNRAEEYNSGIVTMEMREINRIVYIADDGAETVLWENNTAEK